MTDSQREVLVLDFVRRLKDAGSWCGETHIQKSTYFLQEYMGVPLGFNFIFYKHGPFSFDLNDELTSLRGNGLIEVRSHKPYGPHVHASASATEYLALFPKTISSHKRAMRFVVDRLASKNVAELERLATALYVRLEMPEAGKGELAKRINSLKPHVSLEEAKNALYVVEGFDRERLAMGDE